MLTDLQEATQSHKILQEAHKIVSNGTRVMMSVIVVEEADIVFEEEDEGFSYGLQSLINTAKRPVILLTNDMTVPHLQRFKTSQTLQLAMVKPILSSACKS